MQAIQKKERKKKLIIKKNWPPKYYRKPHRLCPPCLAHIHAPGEVAVPERYW